MQREKNAIKMELVMPHAGSEGAALKSWNRGKKPPETDKDVAEKLPLCLWISES